MPDEPKIRADHVTGVPAPSNANIAAHQFVFQRRLHYAMSMAMAFPPESKQRMEYLRWCHQLNGLITVCEDEQLERVNLEEQLPPIPPAPEIVQ